MEGGYPMFIPEEGLEKNPLSSQAGVDALDPGAVLVDVREDLKTGRECFDRIMSAFESLRPGQTLALRAPFQPNALFAVMAEKGFRAESLHLAQEDWIVLFHPVSER